MFLFMYVLTRISYILIIVLNKYYYISNINY